MDRDNILELIEKMEEDEIFYQNYYNACGNEKSLNEFISSLDRDELYERKLIVPEIKGSWNPINMTDEMMYDFNTNKEITLSKHYRYTPMFSHKHSFYEVVYCLKGSCKQFINNYDISLKEGYFCIIPPDTSHSIGVFDDSLIINIIIWRGAFEDIFYNLLRKSNKISDFFNQSLFLYDQNNYMIVDTTKDIEIKNLILDLYYENLKNENNSELVTNSLVVLIFSLIVKRYDDNIYFPDQSKTPSQIVTEMISYMEHQFKSITLSKLAKRFNYSESHCSRIIKSNTGKTFTNIILDIKFNKAKNLLKKSSHSIEEIAILSGFNNIEHFQRLFKKHYDITPGKYRGSFK